jgi:class 3 adenylate cyclase
MRADEAGTLARIKDLRGDLIDPKVKAHHGRIVKLMGEGALVEFASVINAIECAVEIQRVLAEPNLELHEDRRVKFRIGINAGDVIIEGDDIYGDAVNIAARMEGLAEPGGICISAKVFERCGAKPSSDSPTSASNE